MERIVLAYSGGLDTSVAVKWLADKYEAEIVTVTVDLGQGKELDDVRERALAVGAVRAHVVDAREEFARHYVLPALQAGAIYESRYPLATALGRPLIAKKLVEVAEMEDAGMIAHGCTGKGNDQVLMNVSSRALNPSIKVVAPARVWGLTRPEEIKMRSSTEFRFRRQSKTRIALIRIFGGGQSNAAYSKILGWSRRKTFMR
jgi:argininosuccinate synthase